jgi:flagellin-like hook-associated protein FlgL
MVSCGMIALSCFSSALANKSSHYAASISFTNPDRAKWSVYFAYRQLYKLNGELETLTKFIVRAWDDTNSTSDLSELDAKFQTHKQHLLNKLNHPNLFFGAFADQEYFIDIRDDGQGNHLKLHLPQLNFYHDITFRDDHITSVEAAKNVLVKLTSTIQDFDEMLPSNNNRSRLKDQSNKASLDLLKSHLNVLNINNQEDSQALVQSLVDLHDNLSSNLTAMRDLATKAADDSISTADRDNFNEEFQSYKTEFARALDYSYFGNIKAFNDNKLTFYIDGKSHKYHFPRISDATSSLAFDDLLSINNAFDSFYHVLPIYLLICDWTINGKITSLDEYKNQNLLSKDFLKKLSTQDRKALLKRDMPLSEKLNQLAKS